MTSGALDLTDTNMAAPLLARSISPWLFAIISAIAFTTVLGTVSGLILASSGAVAHDLLGGVFGMKMTGTSRSASPRSLRWSSAAIAIVLGILFKELNVGYLVGWAFSVAASANLPALVMLLFWKGTTKQGIIASVLVGMISSLGWILLSADTYKWVYGLDPADAIAPFSQPGIVTIPLAFVTLVVVSVDDGENRRLAEHGPIRRGWPEDVGASVRRNAEHHDCRKANLSNPTWPDSQISLNSHPTQPRVEEHDGAVTSRYTM